MTPNDPNSNLTTVADRDPAVDRILDHNRVQLSALVDGELPPEQARFLLRRLEHDEELRGCWERWQLAGDVLRGLDTAVPASGFADRVAVAVAAERGAAQATTRPPRWVRWGGGAALAASVAVIAMFLVRQSPEASAPTAPAPATVAVSKPAPAKPAAPAVPAPGAPDRAAQLATAVAVADAPRKAMARRSRGQSQRSALRAGNRAMAEAPIAVAANAAPTTNVTAADPFSRQAVSLPDRPWPRALLPGSPSNGAFTVDYGSRNDATALHPFSPFVPRATAPATPDETSAGDQPPR